MDYEQTIKEIQLKQNAYWVWVGHLFTDWGMHKETQRRNIQKTLLIKDNVTCKYRKEGNVIKQYIHVE